MENEKAIIRIEKYFHSFFKKNGFVLISSGASEIVYKNGCSELIFKYDTRYSPSFEELFYVNLSNQKQFHFRRLIEFFNPSLRFENLLESYMGNFGDLRMSDLQAYAIIIEKYLDKIVTLCDFSWEKDFESWINKKNLY